MYNLLTHFVSNIKSPPEELLTSKLYDENTFYKAFVKDIHNATEEILIESPYITSKRMDMLMPVLQNALVRGVRVSIITRDPHYYTNDMSVQADREINFFKRIGIKVSLCDGNHHRKLALFDRTVIWEGSLNILSQNYSKEIMRRIESDKLAKQLITFLKLEKLEN